MQEKQASRMRQIHRAQYLANAHINACGLLIFLFVNNYY